MSSSIKLFDLGGTIIEGDSEELTKLFKANNCNLSDYLTPSKGTPKGGKLAPVIVFGSLFVINSIFLCLWPKDNEVKIILSIVLLALYGVLLVCVFLRWKWPATIIVAFIGVFFLLLSYGAITFQDAAEGIKETIDKTESPKI